MMKVRLGLALVLFFAAQLVWAQKPLAVIPFEQYGDHAFIKVQVNGSDDLDFIFDTGDGLTVLNIVKAKELGMQSGSEVMTTSAEGTISGQLVKHNELTVGGAPVHNVKLYETSLAHLEMSIGRDIDGIIGYDILNNYIVFMDYDNMKISLYDPRKYTYTGDGESFDINLTSFIPHITGRFVFQNDETLEGEFFVDTGAKTTVDFNTPFVESNSLASKIGDSYIYLVAGLGQKEYEHHRGMVKEYSFGDFLFANMPVGLSHAESGIQNHKKVSGIIGNEVLRRFNIVYDYHSKKMYWTKNKSYKAPFGVNSSGLELQLNKDKTEVLIHKVFKNSSASKTDIQVDDVLNSVNGRPAIEMGLVEIRNILRKKGESVKLVVGQKEYVLTLEPMLFY